jgi:hypothetical protein
MLMHGSQEEGFWAMKGKQIDSQMRTKSLSRSGRGIAFAGEANCQVGPSGTQEYSSFAVVEEPEVGRQCFSP